MKEYKVIKEGYQYWYRVKNSMTNEGFCFPCEENGRIMVENMSSAAQKNYEECIEGIIDVEDMGVIDRIMMVKDD